MEATRRGERAKPPSPAAPPPVAPPVQPVPDPVPAPPPPRAPATRQVAEEELGIVSLVPYTGEHGDTLVIYCADPRFRKQTHEFLNDHLGLKDPVTLTIPGGVALLLPLVGIAHKLVKTWLDLLMKKAALRRIVCVAHEDCAAYQAEGKHSVMHGILRALGVSIPEVQRKHLAEAKQTLRVWFPGVTVEVYYASVDTVGDSQYVVFNKVA